LRTAGKLRRVTRDHSFVQTLVNQGIISDSEAEQHPRKNELLMAMGIKPAVQPTVSTYPIKPCTGDVIMLCSDGLCGLVNDMTMDSIIVKADSLNAAANALINAAKNAGGHDNISVQIIQFTDSPYTHAEYEDLSPQEYTNL
jgi:protein phosphatase